MYTFTGRSNTLTKELKKKALHKMLFNIKYESFKDKCKVKSKTRGVQPNITHFRYKP